MKTIEALLLPAGLLNPYPGLGQLAEDPQNMGSSRNATFRFRQTRRAPGDASEPGGREHEQQISGSSHPRFIRREKSLIDKMTPSLSYLLTFL
jgi:hypothetical protein